MELVLALLLLGLLAGALVGSLHGALGSTRIQENEVRIVALLRTARAEAALIGRRLQVSLDPETTQPTVSFEPEPLTAPNAFTPYQAWWARQAELTGGVRVLVCELTGASAFMDRTAEGATAGAAAARGGDAVLATVTFTPDGGSDSVRIVLGFEDEDRPWTVEIALNGADGTIESTRLDLLEDPEEAAERREPQTHN